MPTPPDTVFAVDAVLFDSDGVLVDSEPSVVRAWTALARRYGLDPDGVLAVVHGRRAADTIKELLPADVVAEATAYINRIELDDAGRTAAIPGAGALLRSMPAGRWAVATSGVRPLALARLQAAGLPLPEVVVTGEDIARGKPAPDAYLRAAERLGVDPGRALVVEDSGSGIQAGRAAGVAAVLGVGERAAPYRPDAVVPDLTAVRWLASAGPVGSGGSGGSGGSTGSGGSGGSTGSAGAIVVASACRG